MMLIVQMVTANKPDSSDDDSVDEEDMVCLNATTPDVNNEVMVTINDASAECNEDTFILPFDTYFVEKICVQLFRNLIKLYLVKLDCNIMMALNQN